MTGERDGNVVELEQALFEELRSVHGSVGDPKAVSLEGIQRENFNRETAALCFSGGGIRSAAFSLGVTQGLAKRGFLKRFQYLSTVSGGGYTGSLLAAWIYRAGGGIKEVEEWLAKSIPEPADDVVDPVHWVRRFSNYLSPRAGLFSLDTWTLVITYIRNLLVNWLVLLPLLGAATCVPFLILALVRQPPWFSSGTWEVAGVTVTGVGLFVMRWRTYSTSLSRLESIPWHAVVGWLLCVGAALVCLGTYQFDRKASQTAAALSNWQQSVWTPLLVLGLAIAFIALDLLRPRKARSDRVVLLFAFFLSGLLTIVAVSQWFELFAMRWQQVDSSEKALLFTIALPAAWLATILLPEVVFLGIAGSLSDDYDREWWARTVAVLFRLAVIWMLTATIILLGPRAVEVLMAAAGDRFEIPAVVSALAVLVGGFIARWFFLRAVVRTEGDEPPETHALKRRYGDVALSVLCTLIICVIFATLAFYVERISRFGRITYSFNAIQSNALVGVLLLLLSALFGLGIQVNRYSLHAMYRDRLIRTFLAASRWARSPPPELGLFKTPGPSLASTVKTFFENRKIAQSTKPISTANTHSGGTAKNQTVRTKSLQEVLKDFYEEDSRVQLRNADVEHEVKQFERRRPDLFTGFDRNDNPLLRWLLPTRRPGKKIAGSQEDSSSPGEFIQAPLLVINCALNLVGDRDAVQERKAESFTFTPFYAGSRRTKYRPIAVYGGPEGITLATALTISGAAVSPNAGYRSSAPMTFLMTVFNARLGWWLGHPASITASRSSGPSQSLQPLIRELLGMTHSGGEWIFLSDGGHFENLGIYEMIRRGCRHIVAVDASADPNGTFDDLGNAIRKVRIDLGVEVRQNQAFMIGSRSAGDAGRYAALFDVIYPWNKDDPGQMLYLKAATYKGNRLAAPLDVIEYGSRSPQFPHEPTSDQFFTESQFESYRALGEHEIVKLMSDFAENIPTIFTAAVEHIRNPFEEEVEN